MKYEDIFKIYPHKEDKPIITNPNFNPEKLPDIKQLALARRSDNANRRMLVDAREIKKVDTQALKGNQ